MDFQSAYIIRKPFAGILFSDVFVEILTASFEYFMLKGYSISFLFLWNKLSYFGERLELAGDVAGKPFF